MDSIPQEVKTLELTEEEIAYIVAALLVASDMWEKTDHDNARAIAEKIRDFHNRSLCDDKS